MGTSFHRIFAVALSTGSLCCERNYPETMVWLDRPAILWDGEAVKKEQCSYWRDDWRKLLFAETLKGSVNDTGEESSISYRDLFIAATLIVETIALEHKSLAALPEKKQQIVAVAIPEGPLLPLAILVVHASPSIILVPMEPPTQDDVGRSRDILEDAKPDIVIRKESKTSVPSWLMPSKRHENPTKSMFLPIHWTNYHPVLQRMQRTCAFPP